MELKKLLIACALCTVAVSGAAPITNPSRAHLDWGVTWEGYDDSGAYHLQIRAAEDGDFLLSYNSSWSNPWSQGGYYNMTGIEILNLSIEVDRFQLSALVYTESGSIGPPTYGTAQVDILIRRGLHGHSTHPARYSWIVRWLGEDIPLNGNHWELGGGGLDGYTSSGTFTLK